MKEIKSVIGIDNGVIDAVMEMVAGGYSFYDSVTAIFHNEDYKMILAIFHRLSSLITVYVMTVSVGIVSSASTSTYSANIRICPLSPPYTSVVITP